ncbi:MAG TPA: BON domain-containing protein [Stenomitos sp.]
MGTVACGDNTSKTSSSAPESTAQVGSVPDQGTVQDNKEDAQSVVRRNQLNSDIRAREQRSNITGGDTDRADTDLSSEVRSKLEANLPASQLTVASNKGAVVVSGTVNNKNQLSKIEPLAKEIKGVKSVSVLAQVATAARSQ